MKKMILAAVMLMVVGGLGMGACLVVVTTGPGEGAGAGGAGTPTATSSQSGGPAVPADWEELDTEAAATCPGLRWEVLAAIGRVESDSGRSTAPGVASGANSAGAEGPMQFEPATFRAYATVGPGGVSPATPYNDIDAVYTAAALLCADGAGTSSGLLGAIEDYNHTTSYADTVLVLAEALSVEPTLPSVPAGALGFAASKMGTPYLWGGTGVGGYDCSGLVQAAYQAAGVTLPRVAQDQFDAGPAVAGGASVLPGDLLFFGSSMATIEHVGMYVGDGQMIDAPYTGTVVRIDPAGMPDFVGATRPGG